MFCRSQMLVTIETKLQEQLSEATMLKTGYEEDIETLSRLCDQTEKMVQFDRCITTYMDRQDAYKLLNAFRFVNKLRHNGQVVKYHDF